MGLNLFSWSRTPAANATADASINFKESQAPSTINDSCRSVMAALARYRDDVSGTIVTEGASTAYTVTTFSGMVDGNTDPLPGSCVAFIPHVTNGANPTLNVDSGGALPLRGVSGVALDAGDLIEATPYVAVLGPDGDEWLLRGYRRDPALVPIGCPLPYLGDTAPGSNWALPFGQAVSRTTYAALFGICGTKYGTGDGSTTFNLPDIRGRAIFGRDNMGSGVDGTGSAAGRLTTSGSGIDGTTPGASGGAQNLTMVMANLPRQNMVVNITDPGHRHAFDPDFYVGTSYSSHGGGGNNSTPTSPGGVQPPGSDMDNATTGISAGFILNGDVAQTPMIKMPPSIVFPFIVRVI